MGLYLITVKLPRHPSHDPGNKNVGTCPLMNGGMCTDTTGQHHTFLVEADDIEAARKKARYTHITRIEEATPQT